MGRHSAPDDSDETLDSAPVSRGGTGSDLQMLRENPAVRARCAAGAVVPFLVYTTVLLVVGRFDTFLLWVWIPIVVAGVLVGLFLDLGYRAARRASS